MIKFFNPLKPPPPEDVNEFMRKVQPTYPTILGQMKDTALKMGRALGATISTLTAPITAVPEATLNAGANVIGTVNAAMFRVAKVLNTTRGKAHNILTMNAGRTKEWGKGWDAQGVRTAA